MSYYDAVVVGAGQAGSAAALQMARSGLRVALLERGSYPGSKNMFGGVLYTESTAQIVPDIKSHIILNLSRFHFI
ncbi:MAG: Soluble pyridine nucleotide transhydrogenase [Syntrophomonadaceae bacterium]|nr:Soluble pyridine nucleotide transhydrogenase [Bacillota bacterium]